MSCKHQSLPLSAIASVLLLAGCGGTSTDTDKQPSLQDTLADSDEQQGLIASDQPGAIAGDVQAGTTDRPLNEALDLYTGPEGDSALVVDSRRYALNAALGDIWGVDGDHYEVEFTVTNGQFVIAPTQIGNATYNLLTPVNATAIFHAELFSPGDSFSFVTYSYSAFGAGDGVLAGNAFFTDAFVGYDTNNNGSVEDDEKVSVIGGTVEFTGQLPDVALLFSVTLENGLAAEGHYTGLFDFTERQ